jgi:lipid-A-disaccharide synthase-like uncharacterized protein
MIGWREHLGNFTAFGHTMALTPESIVWHVIGFGGILVFSSRFIIQWIASERAKRSVVPVAFWYASVIGSLMCLAYFVWKLEPVGILGYLFNTPIYLRNLYFIHQRKDAPAAVTRD